MYREARSLITVILLVSVLLQNWSYGSSAASAQNHFIPNQNNQGGTFYLPLILKNHPLPPPIFGVESSWYEKRFYETAKNGGVYWLRLNPFSWKDIEPTYYDQPDYHWDEVNENSLNVAAENGLTVIATIRLTPDWAQKIPGVSCGPIAEDKLDEFARFMQALVARYSVPPYNIKYWEIGNEPDIDPALVSPSSHYGCWGDENDDYYGGGYYAEMLKIVSPAVKSIDPQSKIVVGGLLLDCDPTHPPPGKACKPAKFLEGILHNEGGNYFDVVSFHGYPQFWNGEITDEDFPSWSYRGGVVLGKISFLREVMSTYGVSKPLLHTEGSLICIDSNPDCNPNDSNFYKFLEAQADYVVWLYVRNIDARILGSVWFTLQGPGWRQGGLLNTDGTPKPAFESFQFLTEMVGPAFYLGRIYSYTGLNGYNFERLGKRLWILWAPDRTDHVITLPDKLLNVYDKYGNVITPVNNQLTVNSPVYLELLP